MKYLKLLVGTIIILGLIYSLSVGIIDVINKNFTLHAVVSMIFVSTGILVFGSYCLFYTIDYICKCINNR